MGQFNRITAIFRLLAIAANILFTAWITGNGIDAGFNGTVIQFLSYIGLLLLFTLNTVLIIIGSFRN